MKSYTTLRNLYGTLTKNTTSANLTLGDQIIMDEYRQLCAMADFPFLHRLRTMTTTASQQFKALPYDVDLVESLYVTVGTTRYVPKILHSREQWDLLNRSTYTSDFPRYAFIFNGELGLWPTPATSANVITLNAKVRPIDLGIADITSSTITTLANGGTALTVSAGLTVQMAGFWIRPTFSTTANTGDGQWYELSSVTNATTATLVRPYGGQSIAVGTAACTIAQMSLLPQGTESTPVWKAAADYWYKEDDKVRGDSYMENYERGVKAIKASRLSASTDLVLDSGMEQDIINPNLTVTI